MKRSFGPAAPRLLVAALVLAAAIPVVLQVNATAGEGEITTVAGGPGPALAPATTVGQRPAGVDVRGTDIYVADDTNYVIRRLDTTTGLESIVAGSGSPGFAGDGGPARFAKLYAADVAVDPAGNLYIADRNNHRIRKVGIDGNITTVAGNGTEGDAGDYGPATLAQLSGPEAVAVDATGNLLIADTFNHRVRRVDAAGTITPLAGKPRPFGGVVYDGDGGPAILAALDLPRGLSVDSQGNVLIADTLNGRIRKVDTAGTITTVAGIGGAGYAGDGGPATAARLRNPVDVAAVAGGGFLIADTENHRVRRVDAAGTINTIAGRTTANGQVVSGYAGDGGPALDAELSFPRTVAVADSNVVVGDTANARVRKVDLTAGTITTIAGTGGAAFGGDGGPATEAQMNQPSGTAMDSAGNLFVADTSSHRVRRIDPGGTITTVAGTGVDGFTVTDDGGPAIQAKLRVPSGLALGPGGELFIADTGNRRVRRMGLDGVIATVAGATDENGSPLAGYSGDGGPATEARLGQPSSIAVDGAGNLFIADTSNHRVRMVDATSGTITTVAGIGGITPLNQGTYSGDGGPATEAGLSSPRGVAVRSGTLYIADSGNHRVRRVAPGGTITTVAGNGAPGYAGDGLPASLAQLQQPNGVVFDQAGTMYIADTGNHAVRRVDGGTITSVAGTGQSGFSGDGGAATAAQLSTPRAIAVAAAGHLFIADSANNRVRQVEGPSAPTGTSGIAAAAGGGQNAPIGTAFPTALQAIVRTSAGQPVAGAEVTFTAPSEGPSGTFAGATVATTATATTGPDGTATAPTFTANQRAGQYAVVAAAPGVSGQASYQLTNRPGPPAAITATAGTPQSARVGTAFSATFEARVVDAGPNPVPGVTVIFTAPDTEPTGVFPTPGGGTSRTATVVTNDDGRATAPTFVAGSAPGGYSVLATVEGVGDPAVYELTNVAERTQFVTAVAGTPQSARVGRAFATALQAGVRDEADRPMAGVEVTFTVPGAGPSGAFPGGASSVIANTNAAGVATAPTLTANATAGSWTASATAAGATGTATFSLTNTAPAAAAVRAVGGTPQSTTVGTAFSAALQALVRDDTDNPMTGIEVSFAVPDGGPSASFPGGATSATATTDASGVATAPTLTANRAEGSYAVVARVAGVVGEATFSLTNSPAGGGGTGPEADPDPPCPAASPGPAQIVYPAGFSLVGLPEGTRLPASPARLWGWWDQGAGGQYRASGSDQALSGGRGYWKYFACPTVIDVASTGRVDLRAPLGAYHASIVGNPADRPVTVSGHDYAARYHRATRSYRLSGYREAVVLAPGEAVWVFAYDATIIRIEG